jgi:hypothetical protein
MEGYAADVEDGDGVEDDYGDGDQKEEEEEHEEREEEEVR